MSVRLRFSIVTPSYNTGRFIGAAVCSVLDQDYPDVDYLVMDGGSTDGTVETLRSFGSRIRWVSRRDNGQTDAINRGFARTQGDILAWLNSDDTFAPGAFSAVASFFAAHPEIALVYGDANFIDAEGRHIAPCVHVEPYDQGRLLHYSDIIVQPAAFFRRSAFEAVGGCDTSLNWAMDYDLWIKLARRFPAAHLPRLLANFRWLSDNKTATGGWGRINEICDMVRRHGLDIPAYVQLEQVHLHTHDAAGALCRGRWPAALASAAKAAGTLLSSPRALASLCSPRTWRVVYTGQVLRRRAVNGCAKPAPAAALVADVTAAPRV